MIKLDYWLVVVLMLNDKTGLLAGGCVMLNDKTGLLSGGCVDVE
jgi:hypothetical protein